MLSIGVKLNGLDNLDTRTMEGVTNGLNRAARITANQVTRQKQRTYTRKIPRRKNGRPKWERSGDWLTETTIEETGQFERKIVTVGNSAKYERRLANLPTGPDGINRTNTASEDAARIVEPQITPVIQQEILNAVR